MDDKTAKDLLDRVARGDRKAFSCLFDAYAKPVKRFVWQRLRNEADVDDVVSNTMFQVWVSAKNFRGDALVKTWIFGIARFKSLEFLKDDSARRSAFVEADADDENVALEQAGDPGPNPQDSLERFQDRDRLYGCIAALSVEMRECLYLQLGADMTQDEIADVLQVPRGTVARRLMRAREALQVSMRQ